MCSYEFMNHNGDVQHFNATNGTFKNSFQPKATLIKVNLPTFLKHNMLVSHQTKQKYKVCDF